MVNWGSDYYQVAKTEQANIFRVLNMSLDLESIGSSATTSLLELASLGANVGLHTVMSMRIVDGGAVSEVANGLAGVLGTTEEDSVASLGGAQGELIEGNALTASLGNSGSAERTVEIYSKIGYITISYLASSVNRRAQMVSLGTSSKRASLVTAPTITATLSSFPFM